MKTVIFGVTGYAGGHIASELIDRGHAVTGVARSEPAEIDPRIDFEPGTIYDAALVERLVNGADAVVFATRATAVSSDGKTYADVVRPLLPIITNAHTRLGVVGGAGTLRMPGTGVKNMDRAEFNPAHAPEARLHAEVLELLKSSDETLDWFYVSPPLMFGSYAQSEKKGTYRLGQDEMIFDSAGDSQISGEDFALAFVDELESPTHRRQRFTVGN